MASSRGDRRIASTSVSGVTQDYKTAMRARGGTGEAIDLRTLVLVLRYLNQSHGEFVKNTKGSQSITYTDRKVGPATCSSNGLQSAMGQLLHHLGVCKTDGNCWQEVWSSYVAWLCSSACWHLAAAWLTLTEHSTTSRTP